MKTIRGWDGSRWGVPGFLKTSQLGARRPVALQLPWGLGTARRGCDAAGSGRGHSRVGRAARPATLVSVRRSLHNPPLLVFSSGPTLHSAPFQGGTGACVSEGSSLFPGCVCVCVRAHCHPLPWLADTCKAIF